MKAITILFFPVFFFSLFYCNLSAQDNPDAGKPEHTFNLYLINGYALSYNFHNDESFYLRAHLDIFTYRNDLDTEGDNFSEYTDYRRKQTTSGNTTSDNFSFGLSVHIILPVYKTNYGKIYVGAGPVFTYSNFSYNNNDTYSEFDPDTTITPYTYSTSYFSKTKRYDAGALVLLGIEATITENFSLFAEAHFKGGKRWENEKGKQTFTSDSNYSEQRTKRTNDGWFYEAQFIRVGFSVSI